MSARQRRQQRQQPREAASGERCPLLPFPAVEQSICCAMVVIKHSRQSARVTLGNPHEDFLPQACGFGAIMLLPQPPFRSQQVLARTRAAAVRLGWSARLLAPPGCVHAFQGPRLHPSARLTPAVAALEAGRQSRNLVSRAARGRVQGLAFRGPASTSSRHTSQQQHEAPSSIAEARRGGRRRRPGPAAGGHSSWARIGALPATGKRLRQGSPLVTDACSAALTCIS